MVALPEQEVGVSHRTMTDQFLTSVLYFALYCGLVWFIFFLGICGSNRWRPIPRRPGRLAAFYAAISLGLAFIVMVWRDFWGKDWFFALVMLLVIALFCRSFWNRKQPD